MPLGKLEYRRVGDITWRDASNTIPLINPDYTKLTDILNDLGNLLNWGDIQNVARDAVDGIIFAYKYDYIPQLTLGLQDYEVRVSQLDILGIIVLNQETFQTKVRCHQWTPGLLRMNYGENA